jgi:hypothetical protein
MGTAHGLEQLGISRNSLERPKRRRVGGDRAEQGLLVAHRAQVGQTVAAV